MAYEILFTKRGKKLVEKCPSALRQEIKKEIQDIKSSPFKPRRAVKVQIIKGRIYRWDFDYKGVSYRIGYEIEQKKIIILGVKNREKLNKRYKW